MRFIFRCLAVLLLVVSGSVSAFAAPTHPHSGSRQKVYLLRGFMNVFSPGIDQLADELHQRNISATVSNHLMAPSVASEAIEDCKSGRVGSIVLVGHSLGAGAALSAAEQLEQAGVKVALVVTLDPVGRTAVPNNVSRVKNFYLSNGMGSTVQGGDHFRGQLQNVDMKSDAAMGHVSLTTSPLIHKQIMGYIASAANVGCR